MAATKRLVATTFTGMMGIAFVLIFLVVKNSPAEEIPKCPDSYPDNGIALTKVPAGWTAEFVDKFSLRSVSVVENKPEAMGELIPADTNTKEGSVSIYNDLHVGGYRHWLSCNYGLLSQLHLYKQLPVSTRRCTMKYKRDTAVKFMKYTTIESYHCE
jgi:hypothetical protein